MKKVLAVSGGVDSMTLLHYYAKQDVVVAHFNHGTRPSADEDEVLVRYWAKTVYRLPFVSEKAHLGADVAEATARAARYDFLQRVAKEYEAQTIVTAHHAEDVYESIVINLLRGTGWRGLNPMHISLSSKLQVERPFLSWHKTDILKYAAQYKLVFRQDPTNVEDHYLRNRVRAALLATREEWRHELGRLWQRQSELVIEIDQIIAQLLPSDGVYQREWFISMDDQVALEFLRAGLLRAGVSVTRPQAKNFLEAIRTYRPEKVFNLPGDRLVKLHKTYFML